MGIFQNLISKNLVETIKALVAANLGKKDWTHIIFLRWQEKQDAWCFDIPIVGIEDEPFVSGMPEIIEHHLIRAEKLDVARTHGVSVLFSGAASKPAAFELGNYFHLVKVKEENNGCWYRDPSTGFEGWLCPNLYQFFAAPPNTLHICIR
jgi:hypothetical protein